MQRKLANAAFNRALSHDVIGENALKLFKLMDCDLKNTINIYDMMQRTTVEILGQVAFGHQFGVDLSLFNQFNHVFYNK